MHQSHSDIPVVRSSRTGTETGSVAVAGAKEDGAGLGQGGL